MSGTCMNPDQPKRFRCQSKARGKMQGLARQNYISLFPGKFGTRTKENGMRRLNIMNGIFVMFIFAMNAEADIDAYAFGSLGEAPFRELNDVSASAVVPQGGIELDYRTPYAVPFIKASIGQYNHGPLFEGYLGLQMGVDIQWLRPSVVIGTGVQSANLKTFPGFESDTYRLERKLYTPFGIGFRAEVAHRVYAELDFRSRGYPWWRLELGCRIGSFRPQRKASD